MDFFDILLAKKLEDDRDPTIEGLSVTENGTYSEQGKAYSPVIVEVPAPTLITKSITANGTYNASEDNADGYSQVTVNVPLPQNAKLITTAESYPITDAADYPLPKCEVTVANADKCEIIVTSDNTITENNAPYLYRATPSGKSYVDLSVVGGTVAWNQLVQNGDFATTARWDYTGGTFSVANNIGTFTAQSQGQQVTQVIPYILNHKYLGIMQIKTTTATESIWLRFYGQNKVHTTATTNWQTVATIVNSIVDTSNSFGVRDDRTSSWDAIQIKNANLFDLTQLFGSTIADYIYSLEQATAGAGVAYFRNLFPEDYYPYNAGELMSVKTSARKVYDSNSNLLANYPLSNIELRGIPKLANNQLVYDGDKYEGNGRVTRKYGIRAYQSGDENLTDAITDGTNTVYKLTTSTTEQTSPYDNPQLAGSTEEFVDTREVAIPVGHESKYFNGEGYITYLDPNTSDTIDMAQEHAIMPLATTYISANGTLDVEYWK